MLDLGAARDGWLRSSPLTTPQASPHAADRIVVAPPSRPFDAGLRTDWFLGRAASLLPGLMAATRTGLPLQGDGELTNTRTTTALRHGVTPVLLGALMIRTDDGCLSSLTDIVAIW